METPAEWLVSALRMLLLLGGLVGLTLLALHVRDEASR
jgi:hypothetical protein